MITVVALVASFIALTVSIVDAMYQRKVLKKIIELSR